MSDQGPAADDGAADAYETRLDAERAGQSEAAYEADLAAAERGPDPDAVSARADLLPEERAAGSDDPQLQARIVLEDSLRRTEVDGAAPSTFLEHRRSEDTV